MAESKRTPEDRFWSKVQKSDGCWLWAGNQTRDGYGYASIGRRRTVAHRWAWELSGRSVPAGKMLCHTCDVRLCVNPAHMFVGDAKSNAVDASRKGRLPHQQRTHCGNGHLFPEAAQPGERRRCRECQREYWRRNNAKRRS